MIEVTGIDKVKSKFVKGVYVDGKLVKEIEPEKGVISEVISSAIDAAISDDVKELKSYEQNACGACTTAIGHPHTAKSRQKVFDSGLKVLNLHKDKVQIDVPKIILSICDELQEKVGRNEFSIVCKGKWGDDGTYLIEDEYRVPKQKVDGAAVDYDHDHLEQLKAEGFNVVIHSHPFKSSDFSASDQETINSHFDCSILYSLREFTTATVLISNMIGVKLLATGKPHIEGEDIVPKTEFDNIEKKYAPSVTYHYGGDLYGNNLDNFRGAGRGNFRGSHIEAERNISARSKVSLLGGESEYTYDAKTDTFFKNGIEVDNPFYRNRKKENFGCQGKQGHGHQGQMVKIHGDCSCNSVAARQIPSRVFTTEPEIFNSGDAKANKKKGGKKDNQPKIDLLP